MRTMMATRLQPEVPVYSFPFGGTATVPPLRDAETQPLRLQDEEAPNTPTVHEPTPLRAWARREAIAIYEGAKARGFVRSRERSLLLFELVAYLEEKARHEAEQVAALASQLPDEVEELEGLEPLPQVPEKPRALHRAASEQAHRRERRALEITSCRARRRIQENARRIDRALLIAALNREILEGRYEPLGFVPSSDSPQVSLIPVVRGFRTTARKAARVTEAVQLAEVPRRGFWEPAAEVEDEVGDDLESLNSLEEEPGLSRGFLITRTPGGSACCQAY